ncbi:MAG: prolyl oligopeptidase family serine peptidase [Akkermansiaceae bacterium]
MLKLLSTLICLGTAMPTLSYAGATQSWLKEIHALRVKQRAALKNDHIHHLWSHDGKELYAQLTAPDGKRVWVSYDLTTGKNKKLPGKPAGKNSLDLKESKQHSSKSHRGKQSPNKKWKLHHSARQLSLNGKPIDFQLPKGSVWEPRFEWAPDSSAWIAWQNTTHPVRQVHYVRTSPKGGVQPEHFTRNYTKPGDLINVPKPVMFFTDGRKPIPVDESIVKNPYYYRNGGWSADSKRYTVDFIERGYGKYKMIEMSAGSGKHRIVVQEVSDTFVFASKHCYRRILNGEKQMLWLSQRSGFLHLYLLDASNGKVVRNLTGSLGKTGLVREIVKVDEESREIYLKVAGCYPKQDPYYIHYVKVNMDSGKMIPLTNANGTHDIHLSPDNKYYLAKWSRVDHPPVYEVRRFANGKKITTLPIPNIDALKQTGWQLPERFVCKDRNNRHDIHGIIIRPPNFDPNKKYPVIESIYAGPHGAFVPKRWSTWHNQLSELAASGFIVVQIDGLGTNHRGKDFHDVAYKNLKDSGFPDRIKWLKAAGEKHPELDLKNVGIYGGSAGGQSTLAALLHHGDFYKAGASDCGCHDNRMDKIWWNEQWMDWPVDKSYAENSNVTHAHKLKGALMLTVGELDTNVDPASTYQVVNALIQADKKFEFYPVPNGGHGSGEMPYLRHKRMQFFKKHLQAY